MRFVITGTGRSGTKWCATVLRVAGIACGHEQVFTTANLSTHASASWGVLQGDSSLAAVPHLGRLDCRRVLVVRHPLDVAASFARVGGFLVGNQPAGLLRYLHRQHPSIFVRPDEVSAAVAYWTEWNRTAVEHADRVVLLEDLTPDLLYETVGVEPAWPPYPIARMNVGPTGDRPQWDDLSDDLRDSAQALAAEFGY